MVKMVKQVAGCIRRGHLTLRLGLLAEKLTAVKTFNIFQQGAKKKVLQQREMFRNVQGKR